MTHSQHHAVIVDSLSMKTVLFLNWNGWQEACVRYRLEEEKSPHVCVHLFYVKLFIPSPASLSGADVPEAEEDSRTEATTPTSCDAVSQTQISTVELDEVPPVLEEVRPVASLAEQAPQPETSAIDPQPKEERDSEKTKEAEGGTGASRASVDELLADWQEDLEAFKQMEKDEL